MKSKLRRHLEAAGAIRAAFDTPQYNSAAAIGWACIQVRAPRYTILPSVIPGWSSGTTTFEVPVTYTTREG